MNNWLKAFVMWFDFNWRELVNSKKFKMAAAAIIGLVVNSLAKNGGVTPDAWNEIVKIVLVYLGAQGLADYGKYRQ